MSHSSWTATPGLAEPSRSSTRARARLPIVYVDAVPGAGGRPGAVTAVGVLLRPVLGRAVPRALVSGRVLHHERVREALLRHIEKDLGPMALPRVPPARSRSRWPSTSRPPA